jgi:hypothetical protein
MLMQKSRRWPIRKTLIGFLATLVGALARVPTALADGNPNEGWTRVDQIIDLNFIQVNGCNGGDDMVPLTGQASLTTRTKVEPDGSLSLKEISSLSATGIGTPSGADYTLSDASIQHVSGIGSLPFSDIINRVCKLTGFGVSDQDVHYKIHLTINADGTVTHNVAHVTTNCGN